MRFFRRHARLVFTIFGALIATANLADASSFYGTGQTVPDFVDIDEAAFRTEVIAMLREESPDVRFEPSPERSLTVLVSGGPLDGGEINLDRIYNFCLSSGPEDCAATKEEFVAGLAVERAELAADALRLMVRDRQWVDHALGRDASSEESMPLDLIYRPIGDDLFAILVFDQPQIIATADAGALASLGLDADAAWDRARRQTAAMLPALPDPDQLRGSAVLFEGGEYYASLLVDLEGWAQLARAMGPKLFMTAVADDLVFVGEMPDGPDMERFRGVVEEDCAAQPRCISPNVYRFRGGRWESVK